MVDYIKLANIRREELNVEFRALDEFIKMANKISDDPRVFLADAPQGPIYTRRRLLDDTGIPMFDGLEPRAAIAPDVDAVTLTPPKAVVNYKNGFLILFSMVFIGVFGWFIWNSGDRIWEYGERLLTNPVEEVVVPESNIDWDNFTWQFTYKTVQSNIPIITEFAPPGAEVDCENVKRIILEKVDPDIIIIASCKEKE